MDVCIWWLADCPLFDRVNTCKEVSMRRMLAATISFCMWATACVPGPIAGKVYVIVPPEKASSFTANLASIVRKRGMAAELGQATDDKGYSTHVLDARGHSVRLRSENVPLSGAEDSELCGVYSEPHSDPGQYFISVSPSTQIADPRASQALLALIVNDLKGAGYDVRSKPIACSPQSKAESRG